MCVWMREATQKIGNIVLTTKAHTMHCIVYDSYDWIKTVQIMLEFSFLFFLFRSYMNLSSDYVCTHIHLREMTLYHSIRLNHKLNAKNRRSHQPNNVEFVLIADKCNLVYFSFVMSNIKPTTYFKFMTAKRTDLCRIFMCFSLFDLQLIFTLLIIIFYETFGFVFHLWWVNM